MILKIILLAIILYLIYKAFGGKVFSKQKSSFNKNNKKDLPEIEANTLVECSKCGVFIVYKEAIIKNGKIFCEECFKKEK